MPPFYSYAPSPAVLTQRRTPTTAAPRYAASGGKTFGRPVERLRNSVVRGARKWQRRGGAKGHESGSVFYERIVEAEQTSPGEFMPLLPWDHDKPSSTTPSVPSDVAASSSKPNMPGPRIHKTDSTQRTLRRTESGFFRPPRSKRWRRTRKFAKFLLRILASISLYPFPSPMILQVHPHCYSSNVR
ncbi:hypothetical protein FB45DRAFT_1066464 [Roridomyces roridus]|uniref:Uncharacterized protein n=1 Tax=Roridomyces roridus TaxID=1738132 RepID=A0AAD7B418_9AGAR|nr:hypothetical protein FB45DRAFT_1066464 [Roridomyces roridus]